MFARRPADARRRSAGKLALVALACAVSFALPAAAVASPLSRLDVTLLVQSQGGGEPLLLVAGELPEGTSLPAEIVLPVPEGAVVEWSGEILGTDVQNDIPVEARIEQRDGVNVVVFTLTQSRVGQAEVSYPGAVEPVDGYTLVGGYNLVAPSDIASARVAVALPPGGQVSSLPQGTLSAQGPQGYTYYYQEITDVASGAPLIYAIQFGMDAAAVPAAPVAPGQSSEVPPLVIVLIAAVLAGSVLVVLAARARTQAAAIDSGVEDVAHAEHAESSEMFGSVESPGAAAESLEPSDREKSDPESVEPAPVASESRSWLTPQRLVIVAGVLVVGIVVAVILGGQQGQVGVTEMSDGWISQRISTASAESTVDFNAMIACECPPESEAPKMFDALRAVPGVAHAALEESTLRLRVQYDPALTDEAAIAMALRAAGYLQ